jgi:hypothetical protein
MDDGLTRFIKSDKTSGIVFLALVLLSIIVSILLIVVSSNDNTIPDIDIQVNLADGFYYKQLLEPIYLSHGFSYSDVEPLRLSTRKYSSCTDSNIYLFPNEFLIELSDTQFYYTKYLNNPTHENGHRLLNQQKDTAFAYINDNQEFLRVLTDFDYDELFGLPNGKSISLKELRLYIRQNIANGYLVLEELQTREYMLHDNPDYFYNSNSASSLSTTHTIDNTYLIDEESALSLLKQYVLESADDKTAHKKVDSYTEEDLFLAEIPITCEDGMNANVYGVDDDIYAHMFYGDYDGPINFIDDITQRGKLYMPIAACNCPYSEEDRVNWYVVKHIVEDLYDTGYTQFVDIERKLQEQPTYNNLNILSDLYTHQVKQDIMLNQVSDNTSLMWRRANQIDTKFFIYPELIDDINYKESSTYFTSESQNLCVEFQNYILVESLYHLNFMRWSPAVFITDEPLPFNEQNIDIPVVQPITNNKMYAETVLQLSINK